MKDTKFLPKAWTRSRQPVTKQYLLAVTLLAASLAALETAAQSLSPIQYDFEGNLEATVGDFPLVPGFAAPATQPGVTFTNMTIAGQTAQVGALTRGTFLRLTHGFTPNGGGQQVNQYTLIMDVNFPERPAGYASLYQANLQNANDGEWFVSPSGGLGISQIYGGNVPTNTWNRLAVVVDHTNGTFTSFLNGVQVQQAATTALDDRWALLEELLLFADEDQENAPVFVNSIQMHDAVLSNAYISSLGGATAGGIPLPDQQANFVLGWGAYYWGQLDTPPGLSNVTAIAAGGLNSLALLADGSVVSWGYDGPAPPGLTNIMSIAAGNTHRLALRSNSTVVAWGSNDYGQTNAPVGLSNIVAIAGGDRHSLALRANGTVIAWGTNDFGQTNILPGLSGVAAIAAGDFHNLALKSNGTVVAWGDNDAGQTNVPPGLTGVVAIAAGAAHSLALKSSGQVVAWGDNYYSQTNVPTGLSDVVAISAGSYYNLALKGDSTIVAWGNDFYGETIIPSGLTNVSAIAAGNFHSLALTRAHPPNDNFTDATLISGNSVKLNAWNIGATNETQEPIGLGSGGRSVWWVWTPTEKGGATIEVRGNGFEPELRVYWLGTTLSDIQLVQGTAGGQNPEVTFSVSPGETYYVCVDSYDRLQGGLELNLNLQPCLLPKILGFSSTQHPETDGIHVIICADVQIGGLFNWSVWSGNPLYYYPTGACLELVVDPENEDDLVVALNVLNPCGGTGDTPSPPVSTCAVCLTRGTPSLLAGPNGSTTKPAGVSAAGCGTLSANARWYRMLVTNTIGPVTVSTENSPSGTKLAIFTGPYSAPVLFDCRSSAGRLTFDPTQPNYWIAVDPGANDPSTLRLATGFVPAIHGYGFTSNHTFEIISSNAPAIPYRLEMTTNLAANPMVWTPIQISSPATNPPYLLRLMDTNATTSNNRFYRITSLP